MLTITDIAKELGISHSTVSRALNDSSLISIQTKERIQKYAKEHGFVLNSQAQSLKTRKTGTVGILFPKHFSDFMTNIFYAYVYDVLQKQLIQLDLDIMVIYDNENSEILSPLERMIQKRKVDGYIILRPDLRKREFEMLMNNKIPHISLFWTQKNIKPNHNFLIDSEYGAYIAGSYFAKKVDSTLLYLGLKGDFGDNNARKKGFVQGALDAGYTQKIIHIESSMNYSGGYDGVMKNKEYFTNTERVSLYVYNDMMAMGAINALQMLNVNIPEKVEIIGTDDLPLASCMRPALSTIKAPVQELIQSACATLHLSLCNQHIEPQTLIIKPTLLHRETTIN